MESERERERERERDKFGLISVISNQAIKYT